jgi:hypothetical protein
MTDLIDSKTDEEIYQSIVAEAAKATAETKDARADIEKVQKRIQFILMLAHKLIDRKKD